MTQEQQPNDNRPEQNVPAATGSKTTTSTGLEQNVAGLLCYVFGWVTGIIFLVLEKENRFVRFHAIQSIGVGIAWTVGWIVVSIFAAVLPGALGTIFYTLGWLVLGLGGLALWILLMYRAYQGEKWKLPFIGDIAQRESEK